MPGVLQFQPAAAKSVRCRIGSSGLSGRAHRVSLQYAGSRLLRPVILPRALIVIFMPCTAGQRDAQASQAAMCLAGAHSARSCVQ